jgi:hypothetical protein
MIGISSLTSRKVNCWALGLSSSNQSGPKPSATATICGIASGSLSGPALDNASRNLGCTLLSSNAQSRSQNLMATVKSGAASKTLITKVARAEL